MGRQVAETPQGLESAERTRTGGIYTLDLGFRNRYEVWGGEGERTLPDFRRLGHQDGALTASGARGPAGCRPLRGPRI